MPVLFNHLGQQGVEPTMYASQWFLTNRTCFAPAQPESAVERVLRADLADFETSAQSNRV
eukprot:1739400-Amphidinium_carterae.1